ncbi:unnamed protein product [Brassicogethes aeneus]|uniref:Pericentriolar material 1 protein C-terminal domain-containing protein n=1 Tax=Brassicogethes aeneus TaxID=1431903 RepID=A0A9P0FLC2_BRAAE|nr:unnamed protein product [Brassicogethes aeneus]
MSDERRKTNKHCTGTVPKAKYRNNTGYSVNQRESSGSLTNNLASDLHHSDHQNFIRNPRRNPRNNYFPMDTTVDENQANGQLTPNSSCDSRRNSSTLKCDNVTKYPDKKQIEDKLSQIREYLRITSSLMATMKNTEEQIVEVNGRDNVSEPSTSSRNNDNSERQEFDAIREEQMMLLKLQQSAENKLRDARLAQEKLRMAQVGNEVKNSANKKRECVSEEDFDEAIKELEERAKRLNEPRVPNSQFQDKFIQDVDALQSQIMIMHDANEERSQLIEVLDNRDQELRSQHVELQNKLQDLQNKKQQVDLLVAQMQSFDGPEVEDDVGGQVRKIVSMKDQLNKLKDMLEIVKTTENVVQNSNDSQEANELACDVCTKAENFLQNDFRNVKARPNPQNDSNMLRYDNNTNENRQKQVNKNTREQQSRGGKSRTTSINELEAKKRELEDLMGKHKAGTSNLNHDIGADTKSDFSCNNSINEGVWVPLSHLPSQSMSSNHLSSDECQDDVNEYSEIPENLHHLSHHQPAFYPMPNQPRVDYPPSNYEATRRVQSGTPERNVRGSSASTSTVYARERPRTNNEQRGNKSQINKQLQLIKSVCESMLEQQTPNNNNQQQLHQQQPTVQLRNNLTPSPLYSEPRRYASPLAAVTNVATAPALEAHPPWTNQHHQELNNYQGWLATNTLQTQSFMLNTLNQCCQMLWLQQRELHSLRNTVAALQDRVDGSSDTLPPLNNPNPPPPNPYRPQTQPPKINHVAAACSLPNLNQYNAHPQQPQQPPPPPPSNLDLTYVNQGGGSAAAPRLLDPACANNSANLNLHHHHHDNAAMHPNNSQPNSVVNHAQLPGQLWNGPALNNQVPPGNRANNYWDNFRSYSRQNLLSTKNNEVPPSGMDRSNSSSDRTNPFTLMALSKSNSEHESTSTSQENTPQRRLPFRHNETNAAAIQPDVLNVNNHSHAGKFGEHSDLTATATSDNLDDLQLSFQMLLSSYHDEGGSNHSNVSEERTSGSERARLRNEWSDDPQVETPQKSKLFDELRENVYKEVASLISANEARPHFLIQLFRDLQMIGSDSLRTKILQSIQNTITHSLVSSQNLNRPSTESHSMSTENRSDFQPNSVLWTKPRKNSTQRNLINMEHVENDIQTAFKGVVQFLNENNENVIDQDFINSFKKNLLESESFQEILSDSVFQKHFSNILNEVLGQYTGKKLSDVRVALLQNLGDFLRGELSFIQLIQETSPENCQANVSNDNANVHFKSPLFELQNNNSNSPQLHNGDLAEADQSRGEEDDAEEEGAVGGYLELPHENGDFHIVQCISDEIDVPTIDFANNAEGLDQVPTRLPTSVRSRSTTPNKDSRDGENF